MGSTFLYYNGTSTLYKVDLFYKGDYGSHPDHACVKKKLTTPTRLKIIQDTDLNQIGVLLRDRDRVVRPSPTPNNAVAGVRLRLRILGRGGGRCSTSGTPIGGGPTVAVGVGAAIFWDPCGVAGIKLNDGAAGEAGQLSAERREEEKAARGAGAGAGARAGVGIDWWADPDAEIGSAASIRTSVLMSDGVVRVSGTDDDPAPKSPSSSSMGKWRGVRGDTDRVMASRPGESATSSLFESGTSRSRSSIWIRPRKSSSWPPNRWT